MPLQHAVELKRFAWAAAHGRSGRPIGAVSEANLRETGKMVPLAGLEPALLAEPDFESGVSTNSTIEAQAAKLPMARNTL